jgi:hypothetical protein
MDILEKMRQMGGRMGGGDWKVCTTVSTVARGTPAPDPHS